MVSDEELVQRWADGEDAAAAKLVERHFGGLFRFFRHKLAGDVDDLIHDVFVACFERRDQVRAWRSFRAYLFAMARHRLYARINERRQAEERFDPARSSLAEAAPGLSSVAAIEELQGQLLAALHGLPLQLQEALELRYWEGLSGPELAEALEIPEGTVRSRLRRGLEALRDQLDGAPGCGPKSGVDFELWAKQFEAATPHPSESVSIEHHGS